MAAACLVGSTGLVGSNIFSVLSARPEIKTVHAYTRKDLPRSEKLKTIQSGDSASWPSQYPSGIEIFFSGLATTRGIAGGFENQYKIDHDLNLELAKAAKAAGTKTYVLISSQGASSTSSFSYLKMKADLENNVKALEFDHCIVLRPGLLCGQRNETRLAELVIQKIAGMAGAISGNRLKDFWAQDAGVIAKAAVRAALDSIDGKGESKFRILYQADIVRLGRTEWKD